MKKTIKNATVKTTPKGKGKKTPATAKPTAKPTAKGKKATPVATPVATPPPTAPTPRHTKKGEAIELLKKGISLESLMTQFGWQRHTVRGFISVLGKTHKIESAAIEGVRTYKIAGGK